MQFEKQIFSKRKWLFSTLLGLICILGSLNNFAAVTVTPATGGTPLCNTYVTLGDIVITENVNSDFASSQGGTTLILTAPAGYEFESPGTATVTKGGTSPGSADLTAVAIAVSTSTITVTLSTDAGAPLKIDVLTIIGVRVKASALDPEAASGNILRTAASPGTATIAGIINDLTNFGTLTQTNMEYTSSTVVQSNTNNVAQNTTDNEMLRIEVVVTNSCDPINVTSFSINPTPLSSDPTTDITVAKIYYTGTSSTFALTTLFGSRTPTLGSNYSISGTQTLSEGTNYFWLTYDIFATSPSGNIVDALINTVTVDGVARTPTVTDPGGSRTIGITNINSNGTGGGNWNLTTSWSGGVVPTSSNHATILNGDVITNTDAQSVVDLTVNGGASGGQLNITTGTLTILGNVTVTSPGTMTSAGAGTSSLVINDIGGKSQVVVPAGVINLKKLTINRATGMWSDHNMRLDVSDVTPAGTAVLVLTNGIIMMNASVDGSGALKTLYMNDLDVERDIAMSDASHVDGIVSRFIPNDGLFYSFPVGDAGKGRKVALSTNSITTNNENTARLNYFAHFDYLNYNPATLPGGVIDDYYWDVTKVASANVARRYYYELSDFPSGFDINDLQIGSYTSTWTESTTPTTLNTGSKYMEQNSVNASNNIPWTWGSTDAASPLPINLFNIHSKLINDRNVLISWSAGGQFKDASFTVERSRNLFEYETIGNVNTTTSNTNGYENYSFIDYEPYHGISYYRLKYSEKGGSVNYSDILPVYIETKKMEVLKIFPNPVSGFTYLNIFTEETQPAVLQVVNNVGQVVKEETINLESGTSMQEVDMNDLGSGIYFMKVIPAKEKAQAGKVVKR